MERIIPGFTNSDLQLFKRAVNPDANNNPNSYMSKRINGYFQYQSLKMIDVASGTEGNVLKAEPMANFTWGPIRNPEGGTTEKIDFGKNILENPAMCIGTLQTDFSTLNLMKREAANPNPPKLKITAWM